MSAMQVSTIKKLASYLKSLEKVDGSAVWIERGFPWTHVHGFPHRHQSQQYCGIKLLKTILITENVFAARAAIHTI